MSKRSTKNELRNISPFPKDCVFSFIGKGEDFSPKVYVIKSGKYYKIGHTMGDVYKRVQDLQVGNPETLQVVFTITTQHCKEWEEVFHEIYAAQKVRGEWFELTDTHLTEIMHSALTAWVVKSIGCTCFKNGKAKQNN